jgi:hypothetical protein
MAHTEKRQITRLPINSLQSKVRLSRAEISRIQFSKILAACLLGLALLGAGIKRDIILIQILEGSPTTIADAYSLFYKHYGSNISLEKCGDNCYLPGIKEKKSVRQDIEALALLYHLPISPNIDDLTNPDTVRDILNERAKIYDTPATGDLLNEVAERMGKATSFLEKIYKPILRQGDFHEKVPSVPEDKKWYRERISIVPNTSAPWRVQNFYYDKLHSSSLDPMLMFFRCSPEELAAINNNSENWRQSEAGNNLLKNMVSELTISMIHRAYLDHTKYNKPYADNRGSIISSRALNFIVNLALKEGGFENQSMDKGSLDLFEGLSRYYQKGHPSANDQDYVVREAVEKLAFWSIHPYKAGEEANKLWSTFDLSYSFDQVPNQGKGNVGVSDLLAKINEIIK